MSGAISNPCWTGPNTAWREDRPTVKDDDFIVVLSRHSWKIGVLMDRPEEYPRLVELAETNQRIVQMQQRALNASLRQIDALARAFDS